MGFFSRVGTKARIAQGKINTYQTERRERQETRLKTQISVEKQKSGVAKLRKERDRLRASNRGPVRKGIDKLLEPDKKKGKGRKNPFDFDSLG